ncbi:MAG TPA: glycoside hydrolase family 38 C-terminal domain-containing protein [Verrucomicrobiae bacterium]
MNAKSRRHLRLRIAHLSRTAFPLVSLTHWPGFSRLALVALCLCAAGLACPQSTDAAGSAPDDPAVYFIPFSHLDFYWGGTREECLARGNQIIAKAIRLAHESPKFRFLLEDNVFVANYVDSHPGSPEVEDLKRLVKEGRIDIAPKWVGIFQALPDGEVHARNMVIGKRYAKAVFGVDSVVAHLGDLPGYTPQLPQILQQSRVPFAVMTRMGPTDKSLFQWESPDGSKVLLWNSLKGYGWGTFLTSKNTTDEQKRERLQKDVADLRKNYQGPIFMNWGSDLFVPQDDIVALVSKFDVPGPTRLVIATPTEFFNHAKNTQSVPEVSGEIPDSWPNIVSSLAHMWPQIIPATATLLAAEKFAAINYALGYAEYPQSEFDFLWKKLVESMDHNHDGQGGALGDNRKIGYEQLAVLRGGEILRDMLRNIAEQVRVPVSNSFPIVVFNPLGWSRDDVVKTHVTLFGDPSPGNLGAFRKGLRLEDEAGRSIPFHLEEYSENISRALVLVFVARGVPSLGYKTYYLTAAEQPDIFPPAAAVVLDSDNDRREPRRPAGTNTLENAFYRLAVDRATGRATLFDKDLNREVCREMEIVATEERGGNYIGIEPVSGRTIPSLVDEIIVEETNAVRAVVRINSRIGDIPIVQRLTLYSGVKQLDIENTVEWKTPRFIRVEQLFTLAQTNASLHYGVPFGQNSADNVMPGTGPRAGDEIKHDSWKNSRLIHDWIHAGTPDWGVTLASDHQQIRLGENLIRAEMVRGTRFTSVKVVRGDAVGSLHYPPPGTYVFRYSLSSAPGDWKAAKAYRMGLNWNNPLLPVSVVDTISAKTLPPTHSFCSVNQSNLVISALKKADLGPEILLRAYEIEGAQADTTVEFLGRDLSFGEVNLLEEDQGQGQFRVLRAGPFAIKTIKIQVQKAAK